MNSNPKLRRSTQKRSVKSEAAFLQAASDLFAAKGFNGTNVAEIIEAAGHSTGSFYHRFADKKGVFERLFQIYRDQLLAEFRDSGPLRETHTDALQAIEAFAHFMLKKLRENVGLYRVVHELAPVESEVGTLFSDLTIEICDEVVEVLPNFADSITAPDPEMAIRQSVQLVIRLALQVALDDFMNYFPRDSETLVPLLARCCNGVLNPLLTATK